LHLIALNAPQHLRLIMIRSWSSFEHGDGAADLFALRAARLVRSAMSRP
jgi:hypothetical protein